MKKILALALGLSVFSGNVFADNPLDNVILHDQTSYDVYVMPTPNGSEFSMGGGQTRGLSRQNVGKCTPICELQLSYQDRNFHNIIFANIWVDTKTIPMNVVEYETVMGTPLFIKVGAWINEFNIEQFPIPPKR